jgi:hypothetical protein
MFNFSFYIMVLLVVISSSMLFSSLRRRFFLFILSVVVFSIWGFLLDLDGMMLVLLTAEFTIILLFLMTYIQLYSNYEFVSNNSGYTVCSFLALAPLFYTPLYSFNVFNNFYSSVAHVVSSDFFILYYLLFDKLPTLVILMTLVISFFSLFFIIIYFNLKYTKNSKKTQIKNLFFLRKQILIKQTNFNSRLYTFQN